MENPTVNDEDLSGLSRGGGQRWSWASLAVSLGVGAVLWWRNRQLTRETQEMKLQIRKVQDHMRKMQYCDMYSSLTNPGVLSPLVQEGNPLGLNRLVQYWLGCEDELEDLLVERQHIFCSFFRPKAQRLKIEEQMFELCDREGIDFAKKELKEVLDSDRSCGSCLMYLWSGDKRRNGSSMWTFLKRLRNSHRLFLQQEAPLPNVLSGLQDAKESNQTKS